MDRATLVAVVACATAGLLIGSAGLYWAVRESQSGSGEQHQGNAMTAQADPVDLCDELAAHPDDPEAVMPGVEDESIDADVAITACEEAVRSGDESPRLRFQLARAYLQAGHIEEAAREIGAAAEQGHGAALAYLAEMHLDGVPGIEADPALAKSLFERAADAGFEPAAAILAEFEDVTEQDQAEAEAQLTGSPAAPAPVARAKPNYNNPEIIRNIQRGDLDAVPFGELYTKTYLVNMARSISDACEGAHFNRREIDELARQAAFSSVDLTPASGWNMIGGFFLEMTNVLRNPNAALERSVRAEQDANAMPIEAMKDAFSMATYEDCGSPAIDEFAKHLRSYVRGEGAPRLSTEQMYAKCVQEARPTGVYDAQNFCGCFSGLMTRGAVSRAQRKGLATDFWKTAQEIMANDPTHYSGCINGLN